MHAYFFSLKDISPFQFLFRHLGTVQSEKILRVYHPLIGSVFFHRVFFFFVQNLSIGADRKYQLRALLVIVYTMQFGVWSTVNISA